VRSAANRERTYHETELSFFRRKLNSVSKMHPNQFQMRSCNKSANPLKQPHSQELNVQRKGSMSAETRYRICPACERSASAESDERFCVNDGTKMLEACSHCQALIKVAGAKFCAACGLPYKTASATPNEAVNTAQGDTTATTTTSSWTATRRGRAAAILAILTLVGAFTLTWFFQQDAPTNSFVGQIAGTEIFIGLTTRGGQVLAYICDGQKTGQWFRGTVSESGALELNSDSGAQLKAQISSETATATLKLPQRNPYQVALVAARGTAGVYRAMRQNGDTKIVAGWVLLSSSAQRGLVEVNGERKPVPAFDPAKPTVTVAGIGVLEVKRAIPKTN
jgi:hypothetical protein